MAAVLVLAAGVAQAQEVVDSYEFRHYAQGAQAPVQTDTFLAAGTTCNQAPPTGTSNVNPTRAIWDDPNNAGRVCIYTFQSGSRLFSLPVGNYEGTLVAVNAGGASGESSRAPFMRINAPPVPSGLRLAR